MRLKDALENSLVGVLAVCAILVTAMIGKRELYDTSRSRTSAPPPPQFIKNWRSFVAGEERVQTADSGAVIVVFSDFECPFCKHFAATTDRVLARHPQAVTVVHRNFPLSSIHAHARSAAIAGECAALQGRFATFHAFVFSHQDSLAGLQWPSVAKAIGVADTAAFRVCLADGRADAALAADSLAAEALHIAGTPLVMVNGWLFDGTPTEDAVEKAIAKRHSLFN